MKLGIFEAFGNGPRTSSVLAEELGLDPSLTYRLMRALGALDLLAENTEQTFSLTETGERLRSDHPQTLRGVTLLEEGPEHYALWTHLPEMIRDGKQNAFIREFGRMAFDHAAHDPHYAEVFDGAMSSYSGTQASCVLDALHTYDFSKMTHVCDVGGGHGFMVCQFLNQYPHLRGTVLERPEVIADRARLWAEQMGMGSRCEYVAGNMFDTVPRADAYFMKLILHDWNDDECVQILQEPVQDGQSWRPDLPRGTRNSRRTHNSLLQVV